MSERLGRSETSACPKCGVRSDVGIHARVLALEPIVRHVAGMSTRYDYVQIPRQMVLDAKEALNG